uniref:Uncharacterized protein n=1 Tax=Cacopsylla melanoneura TaxID=428564 RepID=A0A8D9A3R5_9HEMI
MMCVVLILIILIMCVWLFMPGKVVSRPKYSSTKSVKFHVRNVYLSTYNITYYLPTYVLNTFTVISMVNFLFLLLSCVSAIYRVSRFKVYEKLIIHLREFQMTLL